MKALFAVTAMLTLTARAGQELGNARGVQSRSSAFGKALSEGYLRLAQGEYAGSYNPPRLVASGYTDTSGSASANQALSERHAAVVAAALRLRGVPREAIKTNAYGERFPDVRTGDSVSEAKNHRVEISVAP